MELHRLADQAAPGAPLAVLICRYASKGPAGIGQAEQAGQVGSGRMAIRLPPASTQSASVAA